MIFGDENAITCVRNIAEIPYPFSVSVDTVMPIEGMRSIVSVRHGCSTWVRKRRTSFTVP